MEAWLKWKPQCLLCLCASVSLCLIAASTGFAGAQTSPATEIRISPQASATELFAAGELARYLRRMTGQAYPVRAQTHDSAPASPGTFFVFNMKTHMIFPGHLDVLMSTAPESVLVMSTPPGTMLTGYSDRAVLTAVYRYLDAQGCRFLAPDFDFYKGHAEIVPKHGLIPLKRSIGGEPKLKFHKLYVEEGHSHTTENLKQLIEWMPKVGYNTLVIPTNYQGQGKVKWDNWRAVLTPELQKRGITIEVGGHGYQNFIAADMDDGRLFDEHPDWFGADKNGKRQRGKQWVFCTSNDAARRYFINNFLAYIKARPEIQIYDFWPPDGAQWCQCDQCKKLGAPSDRQAILIGQVKESAAKVRSDLRLEMIAYSSYLQPPAHQTIDNSVLVDFCPIGQDFEYQINDPASARNKVYADALLAWRKSFPGDISVYSYYRRYAWDSLPMIIPHYMQNDLKWYAQVPVQGVSVYSEPGDWGTYELNHYVLAALAWNPDCDVDALIKKFCEARYGKFAAPAQSALMTLADVTRFTCAIPNAPMKPPNKIEYDRSRMVKMAERARGMASGATDPATRQALDRLALMCEYAARDLEIQHLRATGVSKDQIIAKIRTLQKWLADHADEGVFMAKDGRLSLPSLLRRYKMPAS